MNENLKKVDARVSYVGEYKPNWQSVETDNKALARRLMWDHEDNYYFGGAPKIIDITVNGETFTVEDLR